MASNSPPKILVVDDNPATRYSTARVLTASGYTVLEAASASDAIEQVKDASLVVLDVHLPDIDGFEVCRIIRRDPSTARTPVVHLSATFVKDAHKVRGLESGADGYLTHPVDPPVLIATVNAFLRARQAEDAMSKSEAKFRAVFEQALDGIALVSKDLIYLEVNPAMCAILRCPREEIVGRHTTEFMAPGMQAEASAIARKVEEEGRWRGEIPLVRSDLSLVHLEWSISIHSVPGVRLAMVTDITERKRAEEERTALLESERAARSEAERANRLKDEFLATLSHELRTPLNAILGYSQLMQRGKMGPKELADGLAIIERNARVQTQLIADLLDVSRITTGKLQLDAGPVEVAELVENALKSVTATAAAKCIKLVKEIDPTAGIIWGDPARLQQVVWNLVTNAVKFTSEGGSVTISLSRDEGHIEIRVTDTGQGIEPAFLPVIFDRFRQADASSTRHQGGLGLGLAIVKHLVELHGGVVAAESPGLGKGTTFSVRLPIAPPMVMSRTSPFSAMSHGLGSKLSSATSSIEGVRVLIVDDDPDGRTLMERVIREARGEPALASGVGEALELFSIFHPHVLVTDIGMPERDGYELVRQLRDMGITPEQLPAIALTAFARSEDRRRILLSGFQVHLTKPVDRNELIGAIASVMPSRLERAS